MKYFLNLFSPETYEVASNSDKTMSGFRIGQKNAAEKIKPGDRMLCYLTKVSRWVGLFEVVEGPYVDATPYYYEKDDPFILRFKVKPLIWLDKNKTLPIHEDFLWKNLSFTKDYDKNSSAWTGKIRASLSPINDNDAAIIEKALLGQLDNLKEFPIEDKEYNKHLRHVVRTEDKVISVSVPDNAPAEDSEQKYEARNSIKIQAKLCDIGFKMGFKIWAPKNDRASIAKEIITDGFSFQEMLPLNYDETTLKTIENIDVIWFKNRSIVRAFEVEHTTSIYSGILRMADLLALQPNMDIQLHLVAPAERREKVFSEIRRPVFSLVGRKPLAEYCTYIAYDSVEELMSLPHLTHLSDTVLEEYAEQAE